MGDSPIAISELQKNISRVFKTNRGIRIVTQNNKPAGAIVSPVFLNALDQFGVLEEIEDYLLVNDPESQKAMKEVTEASKKGDYSEFYTFDEVFGN